MQKSIPSIWFNVQAETAAGFACSRVWQLRILAVTCSGEAGPGKPGSVRVVKFGLAGPEDFSRVDGRSRREADPDGRKPDAGSGDGSRGGGPKDKFGFSRQVVPTEVIASFQDTRTARAQRVLAAILQPGKILPQDCPPGCRREAMTTRFSIL